MQRDQNPGNIIHLELKVERVPNKAFDSYIYKHTKIYSLWFYCFCRQSDSDRREQPPSSSHSVSVLFFLLNLSQSVPRVESKSISFHSSFFHPLVSAMNSNTEFLETISANCNPRYSLSSPTATTKGFNAPYSNNSDFAMRVERSAGKHSEPRCKLRTTFSTYFNFQLSNFRHPSLYYLIILDPIQHLLTLIWFV